MPQLQVQSHNLLMVLLHKLNSTRVLGVNQGTGLHIMQDCHDRVSYTWYSLM
jgi:hypothetical protein